MQQPTTEFNWLEKGIVAMRLSSFITSDSLSFSLRMRNIQSGLEREYSPRYRVRNYFYFPCNLKI